jgi:hypothetical protein
MLLTAKMSRIRAHFCALSGKLAKKPGENRQTRGEKWRKVALFGESLAPFFRAESRRPSIANRQAAGLYFCGLRLRPGASEPPNCQLSAIFRCRGTKRHGCDVTILLIVTIPPDSVTGKMRTIRKVGNQEPRQVPFASTVTPRTTGIIVASFRRTAGEPRIDHTSWAPLGRSPIRFQQHNQQFRHNRGFVSRGIQTGRAPLIASWWPVGKPPNCVHRQSPRGRHNRCFVSREILPGRAALIALWRPLENLPILIHRQTPCDSQNRR